MGIEPTLSAWKAEVLPLNYARLGSDYLSPGRAKCKQALLCLRFCGGGRIRTFEGVSRQIYSLIPLAAREPLQSDKKIKFRSIESTKGKPGILLEGGGSVKQYS